MEQIKKRRNSILKKPQLNDDETTTEITAKIKRRISFSGKKSVKEFIAGEEEATIWGTSYEESADGLQTNSTESGLVNVNEKRIVLRSRRVIVEPNRETKRRSRKKVHVAENDKENIFVPMPAEVPPVEVQPVAQVEAVVKVESPVKQELALTRSVVGDVKVVTVAEPVERLNICSSTFDFINYSGLINKSISIEQSVDVSLDEKELQMFKFRVPVRPADVSPNLSECGSVRDGSSPNIFAHSILMSEEDIDMLKRMKGQKQRMTVASIKPTEGTVMELTKVEERVVEATEAGTKNRATLHINQSMSVSQCEGPTAQRRTITTSVEMDVDGKSVTDLKEGGLMSVVREREPLRRNTVHMDQSMDVSRCAEVKSLKRKTAPKGLNRTEASMCMESVMESVTEPNTLDLNSPMRKKPMHNATSIAMDITSTKAGQCHNATSKPMDITSVTVGAPSQRQAAQRQSIHFEAAAMEESLAADEIEQSTAAGKTLRQTIHFNHNQMEEATLCQTTRSDDELVQDISMELSAVEESIACPEPQTDGSSQEEMKKNPRKMRFVEEEQMEFTIKVTNKRQSIRNPVDMIEDSPKAVKPPTEVLHHQTIRTPADMLGVVKPLQARSNAVSRHTIYTSADIVEDPPPADGPSVSAAKVQRKPRESVYTPADIVEDSITESKSSERAVHHVPAKQRQSIYTPADIVEDSPRQTKSAAVHHQTITGPVDIIDDPPAPAANSSSKQRQSVYTPVDIEEDSPKPVKVIVAPNSNAKSYQVEVTEEPRNQQVHRGRQSICTPLDIAPDSPVAISQMKKATNERKSIYTTSDMIEASTKALKPSQIPKMSTKPNQTISVRSDMIEDPPRGANLGQDVHHQTIRTEMDMVDEPSKTKPARAPQLKVVGRQTVYTADIIEETSPPSYLELVAGKKRESIYTPADILVESPEAIKSTQINEESSKPPQPSASKVIVKYVSLQQGSLGNQAALRIMKNQQAKMKPSSVETKADESSMDMSILDEQPKSHFRQLNDEMLNGERRDFAEDRREKVSLFDRIAMQPLEEARFDMFMDKSSPIEFALQPARNSMREYTMELSTRKMLDSQKDYTMELSPRTSAKPRAMKSCEERAEKPFEGMQLVEGPLSYSPKRQTIHFHKENDLDVSTNIEVQEPEAVRGTKRQTIHFNQQIGGEEDSMDLSVADVRSTSAANKKILLSQNRSHMSSNPILTQKHRQTIHFNQNNDIEESLVERRAASAEEGEVQNLKDDSIMQLSMQKVESSSLPVKRAASTNKDDDTMDLSTSIAVPPRGTRLKVNPARRQTIHCNDDLDVEEINQEPSRPPKRQTLYPNHDLDVEDLQPKHNKRKMPASSNKDDDTMDLSTSIAFQPQLQASQPPMESRSQIIPPRRQTIHCNEDLDVEDINQGSFGPSNRQTHLKRQTTHLNNDLKVEDLQPSSRQQSLRSVRPPVSDNKGEDTMDLSTSIAFQSEVQTSRPPIKAAPHRRQTIHFNEDLDVEDVNQGPSGPSKRQTLHLNHDLELEDIKEPYVNHAKPPLTSKRQTDHFNQDLEVDEEAIKKSADRVYEAAESQRKTIFFQHNNDMEESGMERHVQDDSAMNVSICTTDPTEDPSKALPRPRRMTIVENQPVALEESPQRLTLRKSSFSRTLNFNEIQTKGDTQNHVTMKSRTSRSTSIADKDSPLYYFNAMSKSHETTSEIDRSLAEYLKAEAAATDSPDMSMDVVEAAPQIPGTPQLKRQTTYEPVYVLEESGMQPLQKSALRMHTTRYMSDDDSEHECEEPCGSNNDSQVGFMRQQSLDAEHLKEETRLNTLSNSVHLPAYDNLCERPTSKFAQQAHRQNKRQTILQEESEDAMEMSMMPKKHTQPSEANRRTIHFTNENAVDESFFDENLTKPAQTDIHRKRQTLFFNEPENCNDMDVSLSGNTPFKSIGRSKAAQTMKEILLESNKLFSQSKLPKPPSFESKRTTVYFTGNSNSMDVTAPNEQMECESPKRTQNLECTPTKSKSRIPQLIDSARKLQSMKKSIEFIQQELPNLGSCIKREEDSSPDGPPENVTKNFLEAFNSIDIPRSITSQPSQLQESFDIVETSRRTTLHDPRQLQESFDTVEIPRRATTFQRNDTLNLCQNEVDHANVSQKSFYKFEDAPITISDVSTFFAQNPIQAAKQKDETFSPNTTEALCNLDMNRFHEDTQLPKSSDSEDTAYNFDKFKKRYVELTCDSFTLGSKDDIEKTHLSLVNTLDEASEVVQAECPQQSSAAILSPPPPPPPAAEASKANSSVCRKCKRHKLSVTQNDTTIGSFVLDPLPEYKMDLAALRELAGKPKISDVGKMWRQKLRDSDSFMVSDGVSTLSLDDDDSIDNFIAELDNEILVASKQRQRKEFKRESSFVHRVRKKMQSKKSNWILNELLLAVNILKFTHTRIRTFAVVISFTPEDPRGVKVTFNEIQVVPNAMHSRRWKPFDYVLHYQLLVELPFDLRKLCATSENLFDLLEHVEAVTQDVLRIGKDMLHLVLTSPASLVREPSGSLYIRKFVRTKTPQNEVKRTEFQIEVQNIKKLSFESITAPPLYEFDEKIQLLPVGQDFLRMFLADPMRYMKS